MNTPADDYLVAQQKASAVKNAYQAQLMAKANVVGVGIGFQSKGGQRTDRLAIVVMVSEKIRRSHLAPEDIIPSQIEGVPVDVQAVGEIQAF
ncbi:MAG: hypothetical protein JXA78_00215 [Anaerolineales bacterium]|nr:hypothetical protein [Anaerolineales bacterium]